jgi:glycerophosphoryl diester phosphodiesterase
MSRWIRLLPLYFVLAAAPAWGQLIVGHRGASFDAPENTLASMALAYRQDADAVEGDFYLTRDQKIVCVHDEDMKRVAGVDAKVAESTFAALRALDVGRWKDSKFAGLRPPSLDEMLAAIPAGKKLLIEIKCGPEIVPVLKERLVAAETSSESVVVISFRDDVIRASKQALPRVPAYWLVKFEQETPESPWRPTIDRVLSTAKRCDADGVSFSDNPAMLDADAVAHCREAGLSVHAWTVDDPTAARRLADLGVDSITTNRPALLRKSLSLETAK